jgi:hypothetical protein
MVDQLWRFNTRADNLETFVLNGTMLFGVFWIFALFGWKSAPIFVRRTAMLVPIYVVPVIVWGVWHEVRLLLPLAPIVLTLGLSFLERSPV